jgi:succinate dehydrogenase subunit D
MKRSHKPVIWSLFAAGGTFAAFVTPVMILITGLAIALGLLPAGMLDYDRVVGFVQNPFGRIFLFLAIVLPAWHAAHRLRITAHDFGIRADGAVLVVCYGLAAVASLVAGALLSGLI